ncbi:MAG: MBL fold metallo-hydrolase [Chloroflexota bacterium]|nr:MBL fold metallo-hydrolase [Chloroflexota bacterium]
MLHKDAVSGIHRIDEASTNWFLIEEGGRLTVVDTGFPRSWNTLRQALHELGRSPGDIDAVVLTHAHFDHMGFAERARSELGVPVWAHEKEVPLTEHPWRYDHESSRLRYVRYPGFLKVFTAMGARGALWVKGTKEIRTYTDGQQLDVPGRPRVIFTPGHTQGHCSLHFADRGAIIAGDAFVTVNPYTGSRGPQIVAGAATADSAQALASLDALTGLSATTTFVGHGEPWTLDVALAVEQARAAGPS